MITKFLYTPTVDDFTDYQKFRLKQAKILNIYYFIFAFMFAGAVYFAITSKDFTYLISTSVLAVGFLVVYFYDRNIKLKRQAMKYQKIDDSYLTESEFVLNHNSIEINSVEKEGKPVVNSIYPFSVIVAVFETDKAFYLVLPGGEVRFVSKRDVSEEILKIVSDTLKKIPNYKFVK